MAVSTAPRGLIADLVSPIGPSGSVDVPRLHRLLDRMLAHVQGVLLCGPDAGNGSALGQSQRLELVLSALDRVEGRLPLLVWITGKSLDDTLSMLEALEVGIGSRGYEGPLFWVDTPLVYHSNRGLPQHCKEITSSATRPLILFNDPERVKQAARPLKRVNIRTAVLKEAAHVDGLCGLIFRGSLDRARHYQKAVRFRSDFRIYDGDEAQFLSHPSRHGVLSAGANLAPAAWQRITTSSIETDGDGRTYPDQLKGIWDLGRYLEALRTLYGGQPSRMIPRALERAGLLEGSGGLPEATEEEALHRILGLMRQNGDA
jgi:dihydrodipicolinate synthase/N-acetylneuraminate lyase